MIQPLRRTHRVVVVLLAVLLPLVLLAALTFRSEPPLQRAWPFEARR